MVLLRIDLVTSRQGQGQLKWYKIVEVNYAYKHSRYEKIWLNSLCAISNVQVYATQDGQPADQPGRRTNTIHYLDPYDIYMNQN